MNEIGYFEIAGPDAAGLAAFYAAVFGWRTTAGPFPNYVSVPADAGAGISGGFRQEDKLRLRGFCVLCG